MQFSCFHWPRSRGATCSKKPDADAGTDAAPADTTALAGDAAPEAAAGAPTGKNASQVARFGSETAMNQPLVIGQITQVRTSPNTGTVVTTLHPGTAVTRIATNGVNQNLIVFPDPNVPTDNLMGWVPDAAFTTAVVALHHDAGVIVPVGADAGAGAHDGEHRVPDRQGADHASGQPPGLSPAVLDRHELPAQGVQRVHEPEHGYAPVRACLND